MNDVKSLSHMSWNCKYHIAFAPKYRRRGFWAKGCYVNTVGGNEARIRKYIQEQEFND